MLVGLAVGTPLQGLKFFMPSACIKNGFEVALETHDFLVFYDQMATGDYEKNSGYALLSLITLALELPQVMSNCSKNYPQTWMAQTAAAFSSSLLLLAKTIEYIDTAFELIF